ncbi:glycosyltransferase [bacterium]|nr:glycosyltransferase [bacterium]
MKILHISPFDGAGAAIQFVRAERKLGIESRLITLQKAFPDYEGDICLNLPLLNERASKYFSKRYMMRNKQDDFARARKVEEIPPKWQPHNIFEKIFFNLRDRIWENIIKRAELEFDIFDFDIYQLDNGLGFLRNGRIVRQLKDRGKKITAVYQGRDLRTRGVIPAIDCLSDINFTVEFDHLKLHPNINYLFLPFDLSGYKIVQNNNKKLRICHSPTNRRFKGSEKIISIIRELENEYPVELVLIENMKHGDVIGMKASCDVLIDTLGDLGYGFNSLETMAMGIATCTEIIPEYEKFIPDHPFINVNEHNLKDKIIELVNDKEYRIKKGAEGRKWIEKYHDGVRVIESMLDKYRELGWKIDL